MRLIGSVLAEHCERHYVAKKQKKEIGKLEEKGVRKIFLSAMQFAGLYV